MYAQRNDHREVRKHRQLVLKKSWENPTVQQQKYIIHISEIKSGGFFFLISVTVQKKEKEKICDVSSSHILTAVLF